ncbi:MAG: low molecular weight phosphotyrosine protein phosphatase [Anaerolineae bacterium]|nr:low molecular weight phosphotyrosine protein phosphatase [Anaerolineae bacterium]
MVRVLFVCLGNICRSPMAEAVFRNMVQQAGLENTISIASAATSHWEEGEPAHPGTLKVLREHGISHNGRARQISRRDVRDSDYVMAMDYSNLHAIQQLADGSSAEIRLFLSYANAAGTVKAEEVPDPYYSGRFDAVYDLVTQGCAALLTHIRSQHGL